ncbi:YcjF family protein [Phormidesmis sp. 146-33]
MVKSDPSRSKEEPHALETGSQQANLLGSIAGLTFQAGMAIVSTTVEIGKTLTQKPTQWISNLTRGAGEALSLVGNIPFLRNPIVQKIVGVLRLDWLIGMTDRVDFDRAESEVKQLQQQHPQESPSQIAHRIMVKKAINAGRTGFLTSMLPGFAVALLAIDLAATTAIQTEMLYEIAAAYGLDLRDPNRKGEVLAIFGLALGGSNALRAGFGFLRNIPLAGAAIGAGTNATMIYSLGYAACRFYEAKLREATEEPNAETLKAIQQESEQYMNVAIAQQAVMDQILVHMILASYPQKTWDSVLPELKTLQLEPHSLEAIATNIQSPEPLDKLLQQLNRDFAIPLLAQCRRIAESSGEISSQEAIVLNAITNQFNLEVE